jgi:hypothetical protein
LPREPRSVGELEIIDTREQAFNRIVKLARLTTRYGDKEFISQLYEPHVLWMAGDRFTLTGFERVKKGEQEIDYAQSWLCEVDKGEGQ